MESKYQRAHNFRHGCIPNFISSALNVIISLLFIFIFIIIFFYTQTAEDFRKRLNDVLRKADYDIDNMRYPEGYQEAPLAYDAVWSVALGKKYI